MGPVRAAWGRGKAWGGVGLSRVEYHGTDAEASLTSGRRPSGVGGYDFVSSLFRTQMMQAWAEGEVKQQRHAKRRLVSVVDVPSRCAPSLS